MLFSSFSNIKWESRGRIISPAMAYNKLHLVMLLSTYTFAQQVIHDDTSTCLLASRFKAHKKYVYQYTAESRNGVVGAANLRNGPTVTCKVQIEVPQTCRYVMHTTECTLGEVSVMDPQGQPVHKQAPGSAAFQAAMAENPLKFSAEQISSVQLYPEPKEPVNILNVKRGIISALVVPATSEDKSSVLVCSVSQDTFILLKCQTSGFYSLRYVSIFLFFCQSTVHGRCFTNLRVNTKKNTVVEVALSRDLSQCDRFYSRELTHSPLAMLQKLHILFSKLIMSHQDCNYQFDRKGTHITAALCQEKHTYLPFSLGDGGMSSVVTQQLSFQTSGRTNSRIFDVDHSHKKPLSLDDAEEKSPLQRKDAALSTMRDLQVLSLLNQGQKRPSLFHKLVSTLRTLRNDTLSHTVTEMLRSSKWLTWQALLQCGTSECTSAMFQAIRTLRGVPLAVDALVYGLSLQADPDASRVRDMLSMAQFRQSKAIMYALGNTVRKFHNGEITPEVAAVSEFLTTLLNDCSGGRKNDSEDFPTDAEETSFLVLRVVGIMGRAMQTASPTLMASIMKCAKREDISLSNQKSAVQAFRNMDMNDEIKDFLKEVFERRRDPVEKRVAAYLILMKKPDREFIRDIVTNLDSMKDGQLRSFVVSHLKNIQNSRDPQMHRHRHYLALALKDQLSAANEAITGTSRNYQMDSPLGSVRGNIIWDASDTLPREVILETTLRVLDSNYDVFEFGLEGTGFDATALFGDKGFFPDSISKITGRVAPDGDKGKRQVPQPLIRDITKRIQKVINDVFSSPTPEATAYVRLLGNEMYVKTSQMKRMAETLLVNFQAFFRHLPPQVFSDWTSRTGHEVFIHYIFMENAFSLSTASGFPLKFSLAGVVTPGAKGGVAVSSSTPHLSLMPSVGLEFITQMGVHAPDFVEAGLQMHTSLYHESSLNAKISMERNQIRLSIPAPKSNTQLFTLSNKLVSVSSGHAMTRPSLVTDTTHSTGCHAIFNGLQICTVFGYPNASSTDRSPYYPLAGDTMAAVVLQPTGDVSEYAATIKWDTLREGKKALRVSDCLSLTLKAEGDDSPGATATLRFDRSNKVLATELVIPKYDVEVGMKMAPADGDAEQHNSRGIAIEVTSKNVPQLTLAGHTRLQLMTDALLQLQMAIPALKTNASVTATLKKREDVVMNVETKVNLPETSYRQTSSLIYDQETLEVEMKSELNSEIQKMSPTVEDHRRRLNRLIDDILEQQVAKTDMKLRHIVTKGIEAANIWLDALTSRIPGLENLGNGRIPAELIVPSLPDKMFLRVDNFFRYKFNKDKMAVSLPLSPGGRTLKELGIPDSLSVPALDVPLLGLHIPAKMYKVPSFFVPRTVDLTLPLLGVAEASMKVSSNFYSWEGLIFGGNHTVDSPAYTVQYKAIAKSPFRLLRYKLEGAGMMSGRSDDHLEYLLNNSFSHSLLKTSLAFWETLDVTTRLQAKAHYKMEASSPLGLHARLCYIGQSTSTLDSDQVTAGGTWDGTLRIVSFYSNGSYSNSYSLHRLQEKGRGESVLQFHSPFLQIHNSMHGVYDNAELRLVSETKAQEDLLSHVLELNYKDSQLSLKCLGVANAVGNVLSNKVDFGVSGRTLLLRVESQADDATNRAYSLLTGSLDSRRLEVNSDGLLAVDGGQGLHRASLTVDKNGVSASGSNRFRYGSATFESIVNAAMDSEGASLSSKTKTTSEYGGGEVNIESRVNATEGSFYGVFNGNVFNVSTRNELNATLNRNAFTVTSDAMTAWRQIKTQNRYALTLAPWTFDLRTETGSFLCDEIFYQQDTHIHVKPFVIKANATCSLKLYHVTFKKELRIKLESAKLSLSGSANGNVLGMQMSQTCGLELAGLSAASYCESKINSELLRLDGVIRSAVLPFTLNVEAVVNGNGEAYLFGNHTGQLYSKLLVKAEPLALTYSHDSSVSATHARATELTTHVDNSFTGLVTPCHQALMWKMGSKLLNHAYDQDVAAYNNPQKTGFEFSGRMLTDAFSPSDADIDALPEMQEFSISGFLRYDKSRGCRVIATPLSSIPSIPGAFQQLKNTCMQALEKFHRYISNVNIQWIISEFGAQLDQLALDVRRFMREVDLENKVNEMKAKVDYFTDVFAVTLDDLEVVVNTLRRHLENTLLGISTGIRDLLLAVKEHVRKGRFSDKITNTFTIVGDHLHMFNDKFSIQESLLRVLHLVSNGVERMDLEKLTDNSTAWIRDFDSNYGILGKIKEILTNIKRKIENLDVKILSQRVKELLLSIEMGIEQLSYEIPYTKIARVMESMSDVVINWTDEYEIPSKLNAVLCYIKDHVSRFGLGKDLKEILDQGVVLIQKLNVEDNVRSLVNTLKEIPLESVLGQILQLLQSVSDHLRGADLEKSFEELNEHVCSVLRSMEEFDYNTFVDASNRNISQVTAFLNERLKEHDLVSKLQAFGAFARKIQGAVWTFVNKLQNTKVADSLRKLTHVIDRVFYNDIIMKIQDVLEDIRQRILDMDIQDEAYIYLQRASQSYSNIVAFISANIKRLIEELKKMATDAEILDEIKQTVDGILDKLNKAELQFPSFTVPFTDLVIPEFGLDLNKLHGMTIPAEISIPEFNVLGSIPVPAFRISLDELKVQIIAVIDYIKGFEIPAVDPEDIFGDLKVLYIFPLPDVNFPEIRLLEIQIPNISIPKLQVKDFEVPTFPVPGIRLPDVPSNVCATGFGEFHSAFEVSSPVYTVVSSGKIFENSTSTSGIPQLTVTIASNAKSIVPLLEYTFEAKTHLEAPGFQEVKFQETLKASHLAFSVDHNASLVLGSSSAEVHANTAAKATTSMYTADLANHLGISLRSGISVNMTTTYNHNLDTPSMGISSQASVKHGVAVEADSGRITLSSKTSGRGTWSIPNYSDEGTHESHFQVNSNVGTAMLTLEGRTDCTSFRFKQTLTAESVLLQHILLEAECEAEAPFLKKSVMAARGEVRMEDLKVALTASHVSQLTGSTTGSISNSLDLVACPFEAAVDVKNEADLKMLFPLKLTGHVHLRHDYGIRVNPEKQQTYWIGSARFNQYKYNHNIAVKKHFMNITVNLQAHGEANVDFLTVPLSVPVMTVPFLGIGTPEVRDFSLWDDAGFKTLLTNPQLSFDKNLTLTYNKNPDVQ
uniref:apolipoprotein B-100 isoform X2 n=1 Tax=Doryrhamphus excisus TaxID=161450 RepID=UPI0025AE534C|nr:apolipoprotein B-100 isoform X2 [Doryrhamphus excisus]